MVGRALVDPRGGVVGVLTGAVAWALGVTPAAAMALGVLVAGAEMAAASVVEASRRPPVEAEPEPEPAAQAAPSGPATPSGGGEAGVFQRDGELWRVGMGRGVFLLRDAKGLRYLHILLSAPDREFHVLQLVQAVEGVGATLPRTAAPPEGTGPGGGAGEPLADARAKAAYRERLRQLRAEAEDAEGCHDGERAARAKAEIEALAGELARAMGYGGRDRRMASEAERARVNVTRAIGKAIDKIADHDRPMAHHLTTSVNRGMFCSYTPGQLHRPTWDL